MSAKEKLAEIKKRGLLRCGNLQDELNEMAVSFEEELIELRGKCDALQLSHDNIINSLGIKGDGPVSKLVIEYVMGLVAENVALKSVVGECRAYFIAGIRNTIRPSNEGYLHMLCDTIEDETTTTDAAIDEIKAQGAYMVIDRLYHTTEEQVSRDVYQDALLIVANLRAGRKG